jgi:DNA polymerase
MIHVDLESRSECDIKKLGAYRYSKHPSTEILCIVLRNPDGELEVFEDITSFRNKFIFEQWWMFAWAAYNVSFEYNMLKHIANIEVPIEKWVDPMASAAYHNLPMSLGACAATLGLTQQKSDAGKRNMMRMAKPLPKTQQKNGKWYDTPESRAELIEYCKDDVRTEEAIWERLGPLPPREQELWIRDFKINNITGVAVDTEFCKAAHKLGEATKKEYKQRSIDKFGFSPTQVSDLAEFCGLEDARAPTVRDALEGNYLDADQREALEIRQIVGNTSPAKFKVALDMQVDGRIYGLLQYSGATQTHRWAGRGLQIQNFPRGSLDEYWVDDMMELFVRKVKDGTHQDLIDAGLAKDPIDVLKSCMRGMFIGDLAVCDYAQIEARVLPWLAGQQDVLDQFEKGTDLYVYTASQIYRKPMEEITKQERFIGKIATLALGFQGGAGAFLGMAEVYGVKDMEEDFANEIKDKWREANRKIKALWYAAEKAAVQAIKFGCTRHCGKVSFVVEDDFLKMNLPSGNQLFYYKPEVRNNPKFGNDAVTFIKQLSPIDNCIGDELTAFGSKMGRVFTSGGRLVENMTQSVARDVMADAMVRVPEGKIVGSVHDELIAEGIPGKALEHIMLQKPDWAEGLPIGAESYMADRYRK